MSTDSSDDRHGRTDDESANASRNIPPSEVSAEAELDAYDLDGDGKISLIEAERARLGLVDARLEELAEHDGVKGKLARAAHEVLDKLDND